MTLEDINGTQQNPKRKLKLWQIVLTVVAAIVVFAVVAGIIGYSFSRARQGNTYIYTQDVRQVEDVGGLGTVEISTLPLDAGIAVRRACYTPSGRVLISYKQDGDTVICTLDDDGNNRLELYRGKFPGKYRLMVYQDNARVLLGGGCAGVPGRSDPGYL